MWANQTLKIRDAPLQAFLIFQTACHTALDRIYAFERTAGKKSNNDYKRCLQDLKKFFEVGISRKANADEAEENTEGEAVQN